MKRLGKLTTTVGLAALATILSAQSAAASQVDFDCELEYELTDGTKVTQKYASLAEAGSDYSLVNSDIRLADGSILNLYVYYDGDYSAINVFHKDSDTYYNADSEVLPQKLFSLNVRSPRDPLFRYVSVACTSR